MEAIEGKPVPWFRRKAWILRNFGTPGFLIGAPLAYLAGIVTTLPLGWDLSQNAATVIAAAVTSLAAVGGAIAVWHYQQDKESTAVGAYVLHVLDMPSYRLAYTVRLVASLQDRPTPLLWKALDEQLVDLSSDMSRISSSGLERNDLLLKLDPRAMELLVRYLQHFLRGVNGDISDLRKLYAKMLHEAGPDPVDVGQTGKNYLFHVNQYQNFYQMLKGLM